MLYKSYAFSFHLRIYKQLLSPMDARRPEKIQQKLFRKLNLTNPVDNMSFYSVEFIIHEYCVGF